MNRVAITGANGFVGQYLCQSLPVAGYQCRPLVRNGNGTRGGVEIDMEDGAALVTALEGVDTLVHMAGRAHVVSGPERNSLEAFRLVNVDLTVRLAEAGIDAGIRRLVFISSAGVLGNASPDAGFYDTSVPAPYNSYSQSKFEAEQELASIAAESKLEVVVVRPPLVYGPGARGNFARLVALIGRGWPLPIGALRARRSLIGVRNLCDFIVRCIKDPRAAGLTMLVADNETTTQPALAVAIADHLGRPVRIFPMPDTLLRIGLSVAGHKTDYARLNRPFVLVPTIAKSVLKWRAPHTQMEELEWTFREGSP